jgi:hypothetical protein
VAAGPMRGDLLIYIAQALLHLFGRKAGFLEASGAVGEQSLERDCVPGLDVQSGLGCCIVISPRYCFGSCFERVGLVERRLTLHADGKAEQGKQEESRHSEDTLLASDHRRLPKNEGHLVSPLVQSGTRFCRPALTKPSFFCNQSFPALGKRGPVAQLSCFGCNCQVCWDKVLRPTSNHHSH